MLSITQTRLTATERERHETFVALEETEATLRRKRMVVASQFFGIIILGIAVSVLTYNLWTGGPAQLVSVLPQTIATAVLFLVVFTLLSGRGSKRDLDALQRLKAESARALAADKADTVTVTLDSDSVVIRHPERLILVTGAEDGGAATVDLKADATLADVFSQASPPLGTVSWIQDPETHDISHVIQEGLPPASLDRVDLPEMVKSTFVDKALGREASDVITLASDRVSDIRARVSGLAQE